MLDIKPLDATLQKPTLEQFFAEGAKRFEEVDSLMIEPRRKSIGP